VRWIGQQVDSIANVLMFRSFIATIALTVLAFISVPIVANDYTFHNIPSFDGLPLNVVEIGNPDGEPVVLLHGFSQSYLAWKLQLDDPVWRSRYRLVAVDLRGHGASGKPWTPESYAGHQPWAKDLRAIIEALDLQRPWLVGWSFGGFVATDYLREYGEQDIAGLVLTGSHGGLLPRPEYATKVFSGDLELAMQDASGFMALMSAEPLPDWAVQNGIVSHVLLPPYVRNAMTKKRLDNTDLLMKIRLPTLVLLGDKDLSLPALPIKQQLEKNPTITVKVYEKIGHSAFLEAPALFNQDLSAFITPLPAAVKRYLEAVNEHDASKAVAQFSSDGEMHLLQNRLAKGHEALMEVERFHEFAQPTVAPEGLHVFREQDSIRVSMIRNVERSLVFEAMGLSRVTTLGLTEAFRVREGKITLARQPEFSPACQDLMSQAMQGAVRWLRTSQDVRQETLLPDGRIRMGADTVTDWVAVLREWRERSAWSPDPKKLKECST
jgi:pimeloyl-ACP methyl ester carboxylesterase